MKNHLKRLAAPKSWPIERKKNTFILRPNAGGHPLAGSLPLGLLLRDHLKLAQTMAEVKKMLHQEDILVDGVARRDHRFSVGLFDVLSIPKIQARYRLSLDMKGRLTLLPIPAEEASAKLCRITGKTMLSGGKIQFNLHDGKNIITDASGKVGDTMAISLPDLKIQKILPLQEGSAVFLVRGKYAGSNGIVQQMKGTQATFTDKEGKQIETSRAYLFVVGTSTAEITL